MKLRHSFRYRGARFMFRIVSLVILLQNIVSYGLHAYAEKDEHQEGQLHLSKQNNESFLESQKSNPPFTVNFRKEKEFPRNILASEFDLETRDKHISVLRKRKRVKREEENSENYDPSEFYGEPDDDAQTRKLEPKSQTLKVDDDEKANSESEASADITDDDTNAGKSKDDKGYLDDEENTKEPIDSETDESVINLEDEASKNPKSDIGDEQEQKDNNPEIPKTKRRKKKKRKIYVKKAQIKNNKRKNKSPETDIEDDDEHEDSTETNRSDFIMSPEGSEDARNKPNTKKETKVRQSNPKAVEKIKPWPCRDDFDCPK